MGDCPNKDCSRGAGAFQTSIGIPQSRGRFPMLGLGGAVASLAEALAWTTGEEGSPLVIALSLIAIALCGMETYRKGLLAVKSFDLNMNALMSMAVTGALAIGQWPEGAMVMVLFSLAELIEERSLARATVAVQSLMALSPEKATVLQPNDVWIEAEAKSVPVGTLVRVRPGGRIPLDGAVVSGQSSVNQAPITGESLAVPKAPGDRVFAGTINENGAFDYRTTAVAAHSLLSRIVRKVEEARADRAPTQRLIDRFARIYTPVVFVAALVVAIVPPLVLGSSWIDWIYRALVLMVIACPCALVISTPVTIVSGLAAAARAGILIKGGAHLEAGGKLRSVAFDKTGTITQGKPAVTDMVALAGSTATGLRLAAALALRSNHPVSSAIDAYWKEHSSAIPLDEVSDFASTPGRGIRGRIRDHWHWLGNRQFIHELGVGDAAAEALLKKLETDGRTAVVLCDELSPLLVIGVADRLRPSSRQAVAALHALGVRTIMLTGDNSSTASATARAVGIGDARGNLLPEDKLAIIDEERSRFGTVGMVGDGINDAPALARASIGFAMGAAGSDAAIETADVALMDDDLRKIPRFIRLSRRTVAILRQNIALALGIKALFLGLALAGKASLWMAVFADMGTSLLVVGNGLTLLQALPQDSEATSFSFDQSQMEGR